MPPKSPKQIAEAYTAQLLHVGVAAKIFGMGNKTFLRFRKKHGIVSLPGDRVHIADIIAALDRDRFGGIPNR